MENCRSILLVLVSKRSRSAVEVQKILTECGCSIKTRLGLHDGAGTQCSESGLIILELVGEKADNEKIAVSLKKLEGVNAQLVEMCV